MAGNPTWIRQKSDICDQWYQRLPQIAPPAHKRPSVLDSTRGRVFKTHALKLFLRVQYRLTGDSFQVSLRDSCSWKCRTYRCDRCRRRDAKRGTKKENKKKPMRPDARLAASVSRFSSGCGSHPAGPPRPRRLISAAGASLRSLKRRADHGHRSRVNRSAKGVVRE